ncbi:MAG: YdeI family protein, partial [Chthoniobacterales bacterium]
VPDYFTAALKKNAAARKTFESLSASGRREYVEWLTEAKREITRDQRLATSIEWLAEGKPRMWKYQAKSAGLRA